jgi:hypothetical protein
MEEHPYTVEQLLAACESQEKLIAKLQTKWTTSPPTEQGLYWLRWHGRRTMVEVYKQADGSFIAFDMNRQSYQQVKNYRDAEWAGPIPEPE